MKQILLLIGFLFISSFLFGQIDKTIKESTVYNYQYALADSVVKDSTDNYDVYVKEFCKYARVGVKMSRITGTYTKANVIVSKSIDYETWELVDTLKFANVGTDSTIVLGIDTIYNPYLRLSAQPYDSVQSLRPKHYILIEKE
jgi:hypothetical protein